MKLSLKKITTDRSLQRRWALSDAEPVISYLPPDTEFSPRSGSRNSLTSSTKI